MTCTVLVLCTCLLHLCQDGSSVVWILFTTLYCIWDVANKQKALPVTPPALFIILTSWLSCSHRLLWFEKNPPEELKRRQQGCRAGAKPKMKQRFKPCIPSVITGNVRSMTNKMSKLDKVQCSITCYTKTSQIQSSNVKIQGFHMVWEVRDNREFQKEKRGALCACKNKDCVTLGIFHQECICKLEYWAYCFRTAPHYLLKEFTCVVTITVYIPPSWNTKATCDVIHSVYTNKTPWCPCLYHGWFQPCLSLFPTSHLLPACKLQNKTK